VLIALVSGLIVSTIGIVFQSVAAFRIGWSIWLIGISLFIAGLWQLATIVTRTLRQASNDKLQRRALIERPYS
jgi:hypothetical protein